MQGSTVGFCRAVSDNGRFDRDGVSDVICRDSVELSHHALAHGDDCGGNDGIVGAWVPQKLCDGDAFVRRDSSFDGRTSAGVKCGSFALCAGVVSAIEFVLYQSLYSESLYHHWRRSADVWLGVVGGDVCGDVCFDWSEYGVAGGERDTVFA